MQTRTKFDWLILSKEERDWLIEETMEQFDWFVMMSVMHVRKYLEVPCLSLKVLTWSKRLKEIYSIL